MDDCNLADLPFEIRTKLAELEVELSEGDITEKGYQKKKTRLLAPYVPGQSPDRRAPVAKSTAPPSEDVRIPTGAILLPDLTGVAGGHRSGSRPQWNNSHSTGASADEDSVECDVDAGAVVVEADSNCPPVFRQPNRHFLRDDLRYRSDIREEAVKEALARNRQHKRQESLLPNKRRDAGRLAALSKAKRQGDSDDSDGDVSSGASSSVLERFQTGPNNQVVGHETPVPMSTATTSSSGAAPPPAQGVTGNGRQASSPSHDALSSPWRNQLTRGNGDVTGNTGSTNAFHPNYNCFDSFDRLAAQAAAQLSLDQSSSSSIFSSAGIPLTEVDVTGVQRSLNNQQQVVGRNPISAGRVVPTPSSVVKNRVVATGVSVLPSSALDASAIQPIPENHEAQFHARTGASSSVEENNGHDRAVDSTSGHSLLPSSTGVGPGPSAAIVDQQLPGQLTGLVCPNRVSEKIQQLVNTLKRPKRRPLPEYFLDDEDQVVVSHVPDPSIPRPTGQVLQPLVGQQLVVASGLPRTLESALQRYAGLERAAPVLTCLDPSGRQSHALTYGNLLESSVRIAYRLLNKLGHRGELSLKPRDRVALVYANNEPVSFLCAYYGCILASVVPMAIEVPTARRDSACQSMGFLLSSQDTRVVLTSEQCYKALQSNPTGEFMTYPGWPHVTWVNTDNLRKASRPKGWLPPDRMDDRETMYMEYTYHKDGSVHGVMNSRQAALTHCRAITSACDYRENDVVVCVVDYRRETGLWHAVLNSVFNGTHVIYVPYSVMHSDPGSWLRMVTKYKATVAIVKSRDMHWALLAERDHAHVNLSSLRMLLVVDGSNPWSLNSCDAFIQKFCKHGFNPDVICPCAGSSETLTLSLRRPPSSSVSSAIPTLSTTMASRTFANGTTGSSSNSHNDVTNVAAAAVRGVISIQNLTYGVVRIDTEDSLTSLALQDCGTVLSGSSAVIVRLGTKPVLCRSDELGEICLSASYTGTGYWGLQGQTGVHFHVEPVYEDGMPVGHCSGGSPVIYTRSGFLGFVGSGHSGGLIFICGTVNGLLSIAGRQHNADDLIATVLAVQPTQIVYRGRIVTFSIELLKDERLVVVAELRQGFSDEAAFTWMSLVLQAVDSIHQVSLYCLALVPQNTLPRTPFGGINCHAVRRLFSMGQLHPTALLLCPHSAIQNLPQPRKSQPILVGPSAIMVGQVVQGVRMAEARGRPLPALVASTGSHESGLQFLTEILAWRAQHTPNERLFTVYNQKGQECSTLTCLQLMRRAERLAHLLQDKGKATVGTVVALLYPPGVEIICAFYACLLIGAIPVPIRPPNRLDSGAVAGVNTSSSHLSGPSGSVSMSGLGSLLSFSGGTGAGVGMLSNNTPNNSSSSSTSRSGSCSNVFIRPVAPSFESSLELMWNVVRHSNSSVILTQQSLVKLLKSSEVTSRIAFTRWPKVLDSEEGCRRKSSQQPITPCTDQPVAYLDFAASTTGTLTGIRMTHQIVQAMCRAQKVQCELYPAREVVLSLDPYSGLGFTLWVLTSVYCGHQTSLVPSTVSEVMPDLWLNVCSQRKIRDAFCSPFTMGLSIHHVTKHMQLYKQRDFSLASLRSLVVVTEERPRVQLTTAFIKLFAGFGLVSRAVSSSFGCRANMAISLQGASSPESTTVYVDQLGLRNDRIKLLEKGSPHSLCLVESGKLLPGVHVAIANPDTLGQCADSQLGEIWVSSAHDSPELLGPFDNASLTRTPGKVSQPVPGSDLASTLGVHLVTGNVDRSYARTGFLGFVRRTELTQSDGELHDAIFVVGSLAETILLRGMRFHPVDIENTVMRSHRKICECAVFTWSNLLVVVAELIGEESEAMDLVHPITAHVLGEHQLIVGVVVVTDPGTVPVDPCGVKQRILLRDSFVNDKLDPIYVSYNM